MSEHVDVDRSEDALFLLVWDSRRDPWPNGESVFGEGTRRGALPPGSGGRVDEGELENTTVPLGLQLRGAGVQGEMEGIEVAGEQPLGTNTKLETSSSEQESSVEKDRLVLRTMQNTRNSPPSSVFFLALHFALGSASVCKHSKKRRLCETFTFFMQVRACRAQLILPL